MSALQAEALAMGHGAGTANGVLGMIDHGFDEYAEAPLRCVWSDALGDCSCDSPIPHAVVEQAWQRELDASGDREGRFFHLIHDGGVWQAYGLENGSVRGVYCPSHNSQRAERSRAAICDCDAGELIYELALAG